MGDFPAQAARMARVHKELQETRYEFLNVELQSCFNAIDFADKELQRGNSEFAAKEIGVAERGVVKIRRFLGELEDPERRIQIEAGLDQLKTAIDRLREKFMASAP